MTLIKEQINEQIKEPEEFEGLDRSELNIQEFMNDMELVGEQVRNDKLIKPMFHYGDLAVTNYLLWLILGELTILNNGMEEEE